jgi:hypothetical protein
MNSRTLGGEPAEGSSAAHSVLEQLAPLIALAELLWLDLCVFRIGADMLRGSLSVEGGLALALAILLALSLLRGWLRSRRRGGARSLATP